MRQGLRSWVPVVVYSAAIFVASSIPGSDESSPSELPIDKVVHFCVYGGLGALFYRALTFGPPRLRATVALAAAVALGVGYGVTDELHQMLTPGRDADVFDLIADLLGCATGAGLARVFYARKRM